MNVKIAHSIENLTDLIHADDAIVLMRAVMEGAAIIDGFDAVDDDAESLERNTKLWRAV
jgi:hypothetical protein